MKVYTVEHENKQRCDMKGLVSSNNPYGKDVQNIEFMKEKKSSFKSLISKSNSNLMEFVSSYLIFDNDSFW